MRADVSPGLASRVHVAAMEAATSEHEAKAIRSFDRLIRRWVRSAMKSFTSGHLVVVAAAPADLPEWRMPIPADLLDEASMQAELEARAKLLRADVAATTSHSVAAGLGISFEQSNRLLHRVIAHQSGMHITTAPEDLTRVMMGSLQESYDAGASIPRAARAMRSAGYAHSKAYAERIARTELIGAVNGASLAQVSGATDIPYKVWIATADERTRDSHAQLDGTTIPVDGEFDNGCAFPGDPDGPPEEVINCRCTLGYADEPGDMSTIAGGTMSTIEEDAVAELVGAAWSGAIAFEGEDTGDGRIITRGALNWREPPMPLMAQPTSAHGFGDPGPASVAGRIETIERNGDEIIASGVFDTSEAGVEAERLVREGMLTGISLDLAVNEAEVIPPENPKDEMDEIFGGTLNVLDGTILGATLVPFPAFENARIAILAGAAMHMHHFRRDGEQLVATVVMPFAPFPAAAPASEEDAPSDASDDAAEAIADITEAVNGWPGLDGQVVITIDGEDTTVSFPPASASGDEPAEKAAAAAIREVDEGFARARLALRMAMKHGVIK
jgi:SPP1 gp7 family putative phage head morphogenesis protein